MMRILLCMLAVIFMCIVSGCTSTSQLANLQVGKSSPRDVERLLGKPEMKSYYDGMEIWEYSFDEVNKQNKLHKQSGQASTRLVLTVKFDGYVYKNFDVRIEEKAAQSRQQQPVSQGQNKKGPTGQLGQRNTFIRNLDRDNDGRVSKQEFPGPEKMFNGFDRDHNGYIEAGEAPSGKQRQRPQR